MRAFLLLPLMFVTVLLPGSSGRAPALPVDVFILAGQSNMEGRAHRSGLPPVLAAPQPGIRFFFADSWGPLAPGSSVRPEPPDGFGPEIGFGAELAAHPSVGATQAIIKHTRGGTSLATDWCPGTGKEYLRLLAKVQAAQAALAQEGRAVRLRAFVWMQGERDATTEEDATAYGTRLETFIHRIRSDLGADDLPFVIGRINAPRKPYRDAVRAAQVAAAARLSGISWVDTDDLALLDEIHYNAGALVELGRRFVAAARATPFATSRPAGIREPIVTPPPVFRWPSR